jgi:hypothetical protein
MLRDAGLITSKYNEQDSRGFLYRRLRTPWCLAGDGQTTALAGGPATSPREREEEPGTEAMRGSPPPQGVDVDYPLDCGVAPGKGLEEGGGRMLIARVSLRRKEPQTSN